jgi:hypothetical protein
MIITSKLLLALSAITGVFAVDNAVAAPKAPGLTFLYSCNATLGTTIDYGKGPKGSRVAIPITGGPVVGPRIKGANSKAPTFIFTDKIIQAHSSILAPIGE